MTDTEITRGAGGMPDTAPATAVARTVEGFQQAVAPHLTERPAGLRR